MYMHGQYYKRVVLHESRKEQQSRKDEADGPFFFFYSLLAHRSRLYKNSHRPGVVIYAYLHVRLKEKERKHVFSSRALV